jgi:lipopolysaccharide heptosyltransferase II
VTKFAPNARILIVKTHAIGDVLMATPAIRDVRAAYPHAQITMLIGRWSAAAVRTLPFLDDLIEFDDRDLLKGRPVASLRLLARVRARRFDAVFVFHPSPLLHAFAWMAGIPIRLGLRQAQARSARFLTASVPEDLEAGTYYPLNFQRVVALAGVPLSQPRLEAFSEADDIEAVAQILRESGVSPEEDYILIAPGGGRNSKEDVAARRWPAEKFGELARTVIETHPRLRIILTGSDRDAQDTATVSSMVPRTVDLTSRTTLPQLFALADRARVVICNDSSLLHIAIARGVPAVVPFGPTGARQRVPAWALPFTLQSGIPCSPCYVGGAFPGCSIGIKCLREMEVEALHEKLVRALDDPRPAS